jgi:hypothetical protein
MGLIGASGGRIYGYRYRARAAWQNVLDDYGDTIRIITECSANCFDAFARTTVCWAEINQHHLILSMIDYWREGFD